MTLRILSVPSADFIDAFHDIVTATDDEVVPLPEGVPATRHHRISKSGLASGVAAAFCGEDSGQARHSAQ